jgi:large-conductance mechanosensitive channel
VLHDYKTVVAIGHVIELAVAPVFLLTAIGTMLSVMTNRLARIIDRARFHEAKLENAHPDQVATIHSYLKVLSRRADLIGHAIFLCTATALLVCTVIALLFLGDYLRYDVSLPIAALFILGMLLLVAGLICFLREIFIAKGSLHIGPH